MEMITILCFQMHSRKKIGQKTFILLEERVWKIDNQHVALSKKALPEEMLSIWEQAYWQDERCCCKAGLNQTWSAKIMELKTCL